MALECVNSVAVQKLELRTMKRTLQITKPRCITSCSVPPCPDPGSSSCRCSHLISLVCGGAKVLIYISFLSNFGSLGCLNSQTFLLFSDSVWLIAAAAATESDILISKVLLKSQPIICHKARPRPECFPTFQLPFFRPLRELCPAWDCCPERSSSRWAVNAAPSIVTILADTEPFPSEFSLARWYCTGWIVRRGQWRSETLCRPMLSLHGADLLSICPVKILFPFIGNGLSLIFVSTKLRHHCQCPWLVAASSQGNEAEILQTLMWRIWQCRQLCCVITVICNMQQYNLLYMIVCVCYDNMSGYSEKSTLTFG